MPLSVTRPFLSPANESATVTTPAAFEAMSRALADVTLQGLPDAQIVVGVLSQAALQAEAAHYQHLAGSCARLSVCVLCDAEPPDVDGLTIVPIRAEWPLADEHFVVVNAPGFASALLATQVPGDSCCEGHGFQTMFTSDPRLVNAICRSLAIELDLRMEIPALRDSEAQQSNLRHFNRLALEYQERQMPRRSQPLVVAPSQWGRSLTPGRHFGERVVGDLR